MNGDSYRLKHRQPIPGSTR